MDVGGSHQSLPHIPDQGGGNEGTAPQEGPRDRVLGFKGEESNGKHFGAAKGERAVSSSHSTENRFPLGSGDAVKS